MLSPTKGGAGFPVLLFIALQERVSKRQVRFVIYGVNLRAIKTKFIMLLKERKELQESFDHAPHSFSNALTTALAVDFEL
jgi:hypothetical protein